jgi:peptide/nickel transport system substrate-binding protein
VRTETLSSFFRSPFCRRSFLTGGGGLFLASALACSSPGMDTAAVAPASVVRIGIPEGGNVASSDIGFRQFPAVFTFEGLTARGDDGRPRPRIVQSWQASPDGLTWRLTLLQDVLFHDGTPCDADAVKRILEAAYRQPEAALYPGLLDIKALRTEGSDTLVIDLFRPSAFLLDDLYMQITKEAADGTVIGTGPYRTVRASSSEVELQAHRAYFRGRPAIDTVILSSYPTLRQAWAGLLRDEIDAVSSLSGDAIEFLTDDTVETVTFPRQYAYAMVFNSGRPHLRSPRVRRALNSAVDRTALVDTVLKGHGRPAFSPVWPNHWAYDESIAGYAFDPSQARETLAAEAKMSGRAASDRLTITCLVPEGHAIFERLALTLQRQLFHVGVDLQFEALPLSQYDGRLRAGTYDAALIDLLSGPSLSRVYLFWRSPGEFQGLNVFGYENPQVDQWLDRLRYAIDDSATRAATGQLQRALMDDPPAIFLAWSERTRAVSRRLSMPVTGRDPFWTLWQWQFDDTGLAARTAP